MAGENRERRNVPGGSSHLRSAWSGSSSSPLPEQLPLTANDEIQWTPGGWELNRQSLTHSSSGSSLTQASVWHGFLEKSKKDRFRLIRGIFSHPSMNSKTAVYTQYIQKREKKGSSPLVCKLQLQHMIICFVLFFFNKFLCGLFTLNGLHYDESLSLEVTGAPANFHISSNFTFPQLYSERQPVFETAHVITIYTLHTQNSHSLFSKLLCFLKYCK